MKGDSSVGSQLTNHAMLAQKRHFPDHLQQKFTDLSLAEFNEMNLQFESNQKFGNTTENLKFEMPVNNIPSFSATEFAFSPITSTVPIQQNTNNNRINNTNYIGIERQYQSFRPMMQTGEYRIPNALNFQTKPMHEKEWTEAFELRKEESQTIKEEIIGKDDSDLIAKTAGKIVSLMEQNENEKFKNSKFMSMMQKMRDKELVVEGTKVVEPKQPAGQLANYPNNIELSQNYADEFMSPSTEEYFSSYDMAQEFANRKLNWEEMPLTDAPPKNWANNFAPLSGPHYASDVSHDIGLQDNFRETQQNHTRPGHWINEQNIDFDAIAEMSQYKSKMQDYSEETNIMEDLIDERKILEERQELDESWMKLNNDRLGYRNLFNRSELLEDYKNYSFVSNNPYLNMTKTDLTKNISNNNLTESILVTEALLQKNPVNAHMLWCQLGKMQQENENEQSAISAFNRAIELNPEYLDPYLSVAVAYTNENLLNEAYNAIGTWLSKNPIYHDLFPDGYKISSSPINRHEDLVAAYMRAAKSNPGENLDADVQTALGVLFNISAEFDKAVDCFEAALQRNPEDYQIWNRLGATLANAGNSDRALESYFTALQINPNYIRTRYNLAIACMQMGQLQEAAGYLLGAIALQESNLTGIMQKTTPELLPEMRKIQLSQSDVVWNALKLLFTSYMPREDLLKEVEAKNIQAFRAEFDF